MSESFIPNSLSLPTPSASRVDVSLHASVPSANDFDADLDADLTADEQTVDAQTVDEQAIDKPTVDDPMMVESVHVIPWRDGLRLGHGVDGVTGDGRAMAVELFEPQPISGKSVSGEVYQYLHLCSTVDSLRDTLTRISSGDGALHFESLDLHASAKYSVLHHARCSWNSFCLVAQWKSIRGTECLPSGKHKLGKVAEDLLRENPQRFRRKYGDYFVAGYKSGSQFDAVLTFEYRDAAQKESVLESLSIGGDAATPYFNAKANLQHDLTRLSTAFAESVDASVFISMRGVDDDKVPRTYLKRNGLKNETEVLSILDSFTRSRAAEPVSAELWSYALIESVSIDTICKTLPVNVDVFTELSKIRRQIFSCRMVVMSISSAHLDRELLNSLDELALECRNRRSHLPTDDAHRTRLLTLANKLKNEFDHLLAASQLWTEVAQSYAGDNVAHDQWHTGPSTAGIQRAHIQKPIKLVVKKAEDLIVPKRALQFPRSHRNIAAGDFSTAAAPAVTSADVVERIVGWKVIPLNGRGEMRALRSHAGLLTPWNGDPLFSISSGVLGTRKWSITVVVVADKYLEDLVRRQHSNTFQRRSRNRPSLLGRAFGSLRPALPGASPSDARRNGQKEPARDAHDDALGGLGAPGRDDQMAIKDIEIVLPNN